MNILTIDIGGTNVKVLATGQSVRRKFPSGRTLTPQRMLSTVKKLVRDWKYDVVSIGYPGRVVGEQVVSEARNLGKGWVGFDFAAAFGVPVRIMNDAAMQALGSYNGGTMLFLGLGTGLGATLIVNDEIVPMEWGHFPYRTGKVEDYVGKRGLKRLGKKKWRKHVMGGIDFMDDVFHVSDVVIGGGNAKLLKKLPDGCRVGSNANAFLGGFRMWEDSSERESSRETSRTIDISAGRGKSKPERGRRA